jgi:hypothetical protein
MKRIFTILVVLVVIVYTAAIFITVEPDEQRPGTRLGGEVEQAAVTDWSFLTGQNKIFVETQTWYLIPHSVTTVAWVTDNALYVPCAYCDAKRWPKNVASNPNVRLKINGKLYERSAVRITDAADAHRLLNAGSLHRLKDAVVFRMDPR